MKYKQTVIKTPTNKFIIVGSNIDSTIANSVYENEIDARNALSEMASCSQCGSDIDMMVLFTKYGICDSCTKKNHKKAIA